MLENANTTAQLLLAIVLVGSIFVGLVAWSIRLEMKVSTLEKAHQDEKTIRDTLFIKIDALQASLNTLLVQMGRLEERVKMHE